MYDLVIIGGGVSALAAAICAGKKNKKVLIIDKNEKLCKKIYATGNGRCNITNENIDYAAHYNSSNPDYISILEACIGKTPYEDIINFLDDIGIVPKTINGYVYPMSLQASSFVWALLDKIKQYNIDTKLKCMVTNIQKDKDIFIIESDKAIYNAQNILLACGGAGYKALGGTMEGYKLACELGHSIVKIYPALCGFKCKEIGDELSGVRAVCDAKLYSEDDCLIASETGELQIGNETLSGINIFNLTSKYIKQMRNNKKCYISFDFLHCFNLEDIKDKILGNPYRTIHAALNSFINDKLALSILNKLEIDRKILVSRLDKSMLDEIIYMTKKYRFNIDGIKDFENAQVTSGGVDLTEIDNNFASKRIRGLYFAGEMLDVDGLCGGYNITFAILSGIKVGKQI